MYRRILVPLDGSACSEGALPHAQAIAEKFGAELVLLRVVEPTSLAIPTATMAPMETGLWNVGPGILPEIEEDREDAAEEYIEAEAGQLGGTPVITEVEWGGAVDQIAESAREHQVDLIVMGTHGRQGLERFFFGSTSESLLHETHVPILLVRQPEGAEDG